MNSQTTNESPQSVFDQPIEDIQKIDKFEPDESVTLKEAEPTILCFLVAGGVAGAVSRTLTAPCDRLKVLLQVQSSIASQHGKFTIFSGIKGIYKEGGLLSFWRGNYTNVLKSIPETAIMFTSFETLKKLFCEDTSKPKTHEYFLAGSLSGFITRTIIYPLDVTKTRMVAAPSGTYKGICHCMKMTYKVDGWRGFYHGMVPTLGGVMPYFGINFTIYETLKCRYIKYWTNNNFSSCILLLFGAIASAVAQFVVYPTTILMARLQTQGTPGHLLKYDGVIDCIQKIWRYDGIRGMYRGLSANYMKTIPSVAISYFTYECVKRNIMEGE